MNKFKVKGIKSNLFVNVIKFIYKGIHSNFKTMVSNNFKFKLPPGADHVI